jgi:hypothetical protein
VIVLALGLNAAASRFAFLLIGIRETKFRFTEHVPIVRYFKFPTCAMLRAAIRPDSIVADTCAACFRHSFLFVIGRRLCGSGTGDIPPQETLTAVDSALRGPCFV